MKHQSKSEKPKTAEKPHSDHKSKKKAYAAPKLKVAGKLDQMTAGSGGVIE